MIGYMTNAFGPLVGAGGGVTSVKDIRYLTLCDDEDTIRQISNVGFHGIEVLEGNLTKYSDDPQVLIDLLARYDVSMMSVCVGANFIYRDAFEDEMVHLEDVARMGEKVGLKYFVLCGGAIRGKGIQDGDIELMAEAIGEVQKMTESYGITSVFHQHLGSLIERSREVDAFFACSDVAVCPDLAHLQAAGIDPLSFVKKYYDRIPFVHLKDLDDQGFAPLGTGTVDNRAVIDYMNARGYQGDWLVECDGYAGDPVEACRTSYQYLEGILV